MRYLTVASVLLAVAGCIKQLPPAPIPEPVPPAVAAGAAPAPGTGRLIVDVVDGPAPVQRVRMEARPSPNAQGVPTVRFEQTPTELCPAAPCVTDVPVGNILLGFPVIGDQGALETELVNVGPDPSVYRRSLSVYTDNSGATRVLGIIATSLGAASAITGTALLPIGLSKGNDGLTLAGGVSLGGGLALVAIGIMMIRADSPTFRPGSSNHYVLTR
ncbi:MAG: hypothetical protein AB7T06_35495 [Kofleriaceae bacterium]